jgi:hypothetical protein
MKSLVYAVYGLMNGLTGFVFVLVTLIHFDNPAEQLLFYTCLLACCVTVFGLLTVFYFDYRDPMSVDDGCDYEDEEEKNENDAEGVNKRKDKANSEVKWKIIPSLLRSKEKKKDIHHHIL